METSVIYLDLPLPANS